MTAFASRSGGQMGIALAGGQHPIVTGLTTTGHTLMVETIDRPAAGIMAVVTGCGGRDMVGMFAGGYIAVMTGLTGL